MRSTGDVVRSNLKKQTIVEITVQIHNQMVISIGLQPMSHTTHLEVKAEETTGQLHQETPHSLMECSPQEPKYCGKNTHQYNISLTISKCSLDGPPSWILLSISSLVTDREGTQCTWGKWVGLRARVVLV